MVDKSQDTILAEYGNIDDWIPVMSDQQIEQKRLLIIRNLQQNIVNQCKVKCTLLNNQLSCLIEIIANKNNELLNGYVELIEVLNAFSILAQQDLFYVKFFAQSFDYGDQLQ